MSELLIWHIAIEVILCAVGGIVIWRIYRKKNNKCLKCKYLAKYSRRGFWKYSCTEGGRYTGIFLHDFDYPPQYCKYYEAKEESDNG